MAWCKQGLGDDALTAFIFKGDGDKHEDNWKKLEKIGVGAYGEVFKAKVQLAANECEIAVKQIHIDKENAKKSAETELNAYNKLSHERIVKFYGFCSYDFEMFIFMEYMHLGSLASYIGKNGALKEDHVRHFSRQLVEGINYLHNQNVIHRDIKSVNILMKDKGNVKLTDFGICKILEDVSKASTTNIGTIRYMAPEMSQPNYGHSVDIWALGCVVLEMLTGEMPFSKIEYQQVQYVLYKAEETPLNHLKCDLPVASMEFLQKLLKVNSSERPKIQDLLNNDNYITGANSFSMQLLLEENTILKDELAQCLSRMEEMENKNKQLIQERDEHLKICELNKSRTESCNLTTFEKAATNENNWERSFNLLTEELSKSGTITPMEDNLLNFTDCSQNPGHTGFILVQNLKMVHLPVGYQKNLSTAIQAIADLTVKVTVSLVSSGRPAVWPQPINKPYPTGKTIIGVRLGSGIVCGLEKFTGGVRQGGSIHKKLTTCPCNECKYSPRPKQEWWEVTVQTAKQLIFDNTEANSANCMLFYDSYNSHGSYLNSFTIANSSTEMDLCRIKCTICNPQIADKLKNSLELMDSSLKKLDKELERFKDVDKLAVFVSHPHGLPKHVSLGEWKEKILVGGKKPYYQFTYSTNACEGCLGAFVYCLGYSGLTWWKSTIYGGPYV
ncbi:serine/threonine-protein kinase 4-like isoform X2 [Biomphalaria glabrata]|nr:serine/threonine-protein kinase 4-like isoform X2 [Biomphalaria glabrata]